MNLIDLITPQPERKPALAPVKKDTSKNKIKGECIDVIAIKDDGSKPTS